MVGRFGLMFKTLYSRLALTLFVLLCLVGLILIQLIGRSSTLYQQEVTQKLNTQLAEHIVADQPLIQNQKINHPALDVLFHNLMVINPSIELYLLNKQGDVLAFSAEDGKIKRTQVNLEPVSKFLSGDAQFPLKGDDPRNLKGHKVFSAAEIKNENGLQGYLYIVLGGEQYDDVVLMLGNSYILNSALIVLLVALSAVMIGGLIVFALQTRRLRLLCSVIRNYASDDSSKLLRFPEEGNTNDEIDEIGQQFNIMAEKINNQIQDLKRMDGMRREMVANVSHDLRTPLTTMRGYLETLLLKRGDLTEKEQEKYLQTALNHSQHLAKLVEELFELARLDSCESVVYSEPFSMSELVQDVTQSFLLRAQQKSIQMEAVLNPETSLVYGDIAMMQRVLENLLENGLRHTPEGGSISVSINVDSGKIGVQITDTGCGIPAEDVPRIFERFYQQDTNRSDSKSAGLGLAIAQRILELHGSIITVRSKVDEGTTFSFQLAAKL